MREQREENPGFEEIAKDLMSLANYATTVWYTNEDRVHQLASNIIGKLKDIIRCLEELFPQSVPEEISCRSISDIPSEESRIISEKLRDNGINGPLPMPLSEARRRQGRCLEK